jgi:hypothetical protein
MPTVTVLATNRAKDPTFESGIGGAQSSTSAALYPMVYDTAIKDTGVQSIRTDRQTGTPNTNIGVVNLAPTANANLMAIPVTPGEVVSGSARVRASVDYRGRINFGFRDAANVVLSTASGPLILGLLAGQWTTVAFENVVVPANATLLVPLGAVLTSASGVNTVGGEQAWFDSLIVVSGPTVEPYFDGDTAGAGAIAYRWTGTRNQSTSEKVETIPDPPPPSPDVLRAQVWVNGSQLPDTGAGYGVTPTGLADVKVTWGREDSETQPEAATASFTVVAPATGTAGTVLVPAGATVEIKAGDPAAAPALIWTSTTGIWTAQTGSWEDQPTGWTVVFTGRITDVATGTDPDGYAVSCTAADITAEYGHRYIGDQPWPLEAVVTRAGRICDLAGIPEIVWPTTWAAVPVSWRDVDSTSAFELLQELADSIGCVLRLRFGPGGSSLWVDDPATRIPLLTLALVGGVVVIQPVTGQPAQIDLTACVIDADPVVIRQDTETIVSITQVSWLEQTLDDKGQPAPTERTETRTDTLALAAYGTRRLGLSTQLTTQTDAGGLADRRLARSATAAWKLDQVTWDLADGGDISAALALLDGRSRIAAPVSVSDLPAWSPVGGALVGWVEGGTYTYSDTGWSLAMNIAPATTAGQSVTWAAIPAGWTWAQFDPAILWRDLYGVGYVTP